MNLSKIEFRSQNGISSNFDGGGEDGSAHRSTRARARPRARILSSPLCLWIAATSGEFRVPVHGRIR
jgi:hypothetical protein